MTGTERRLIQSTTVLATDLSDDETVMLDPDSAKYFGMSETGPAVWREFAEASTVDAVVERLAVRFSADEGVIRNDVDAFVADLVERKLLVDAD